MSYTIKRFITGLFIVVFDIAVYIFLGLLLMDYDDFYDESKGEYWSFESMTSSQKIVVIGLNIWNVINMLAVFYILYRFFKNLYAFKIRN